MEDVLKSPTVGDVIAKLQMYDPSIPFRIYDPDTGWCIMDIHVEMYHKSLTFTGEYGEMSNYWPDETGEVQ